jgi:hypothetical protein
MTVFHTHFLHCDLIHNGDVAPQNYLMCIAIYRIKKCNLLNKDNFFHGLTALVRLDVITDVSGLHSDTTLGRTPGRVISLMQRPLPDHIQHTQETGINVHGGMRTRNPNKRAAADPRHSLT